MLLSFIRANSCNDSRRGKNAISANRKLNGGHKSKEAEENTIRKLYGISIDKNSVHGSDSFRKCKKGNKFFFKKLISS